MITKTTLFLNPVQQYFSIVSEVAVGRKQGQKSLDFVGHGAAILKPSSGMRVVNYAIRGISVSKYYFKLATGINLGLFDKISTNGKIQEPLLASQQRFAPQLMYMILKGSNFSFDGAPI